MAKSGKSRGPKGPSRRKKRARRKRKSRGRGGSVRVSAPGEAFLAVALASPDFIVTEFDGIPDEYSGRVIAKCDSSVNEFPPADVPDGDDLYIFSSNCPGIAYFYGHCPSGMENVEMAWKPVEYSTMRSLFPSVETDHHVSAFRFAGAQIEIVPTINSMSWAGNIQCYRGNITTSVSAEAVSGTAGTGNRTSLVGTRIVRSVKPEKVCPFNVGMYAVVRQSEPDYDWTPVMVDASFNELYEHPETFLKTSTFNNPMIGFGHLETVLFKIPKVSKSSHVGLLRTWHAMELQVNNSSVLYEYSRFSPPHDPRVMQLIRAFYRDMPPCVGYADNDSFWKTFLEWVHTVGPVVSVTLPGPWAMGVEGVSLLAGAASRLLK